jgi:hypothetical protein
LVTFRIVLEVTVLDEGAVAVTVAVGTVASKRAGTQLEELVLLLVVVLVVVVVALVAMSCE